MNTEALFAIIGFGLLAWVALLTLMVVGTLRQLGIINRRLGIVASPWVSGHGPEVGTRFEEIAVFEVAVGDEVSLDLTKDTILVLFVSPTCSTCRELLAEMPDHHPSCELVLISESGLDAAREWARRDGISRLYADPDGGAAEELQAAGVTPLAIVMVEGTVIASAIPNHWDEALKMIAHAQSPEHVEPGAVGPDEPHPPGDSVEVPR